MDTRERMRKVLNTMIRSADKGHVEPVFRLKSYYEKLAPEVYSDPLTELDCEYDNCMQSAFLAAVYLKKGETEFYNELLLDAKERLSRLPK